MRPRERGGGSLWVQTPLAQSLLRGKHFLPILVTSYELGVVNTSEMIRSVKGHPAAIIKALCVLEGLGVLSRRRSSSGRHVVEIRLTLKGLQLMDTPINHWGRLVRKWSSLSPRG